MDSFRHSLLHLSALTLAGAGCVSVNVPSSYQGEINTVITLPAERPGDSGEPPPQWLVDVFAKSETTRLMGCLMAGALQHHELRGRWPRNSAELEYASLFTEADTEVLSSLERLNVQSRGEVLVVDFIADGTGHVSFQIGPSAENENRE